ncbi:hypothetical protein PC120_g18346 [Phytophthora cactorum]|nr:hypothetical protein PC120_g18346 [Phytophthora cactorum]
MYDPLTELFVPLFFMLATSQTQDFYKKLFQCIKFAVGVKPNPKAVVCDFETALIFAVRDHFPSTRIIGCLFHFKQACRRKMKKYQLSETEAAPYLIQDSVLAWDHNWSICSTNVYIPLGTAPSSSTKIGCSTVLVSTPRRSQRDTNILLSCTAAGQVQKI